MRTPSEGFSERSDQESIDARADVLRQRQATLEAESRILEARVPRPLTAAHRRGQERRNRAQTGRDRAASRLLRAEEELAVLHAERDRILMGGTGFLAAPARLKLDGALR